MRKEAKVENAVNLSNVDGYHGSRGNSGNYAFNGWSTRKYFTSDRFILLNERFQRADGKPLQGYGLEIETECNGITSTSVYAEVLQKIVFEHFPADLFKLQRDGSLGGSTSAEAITQPMTQAFVRNQYKNFKLMYNTYFDAFNVSCSASGRCGMHVNISNACFGKTKAVQDDSIRKLLFFVNKFYTLSCALFARNVRHTMYCACMSMYANKETAKRADLTSFGSSHGVCYNLGHYLEGRVELRLVGGQKDYGCFRNTMESVFWLVNNLRNVPWKDMENLERIFRGCNQYVYDRLKTKCHEAGAIDDATLSAIRATVKREELL